MACTVRNAVKYFTNRSFCSCSYSILQLQTCKNTRAFRSIYTSSQLRDDSRDPAPVFFKQDVQQLLKKLTRVDLKKVFRKRKEGQTLEPPEYKFMTTDELNQALKNAEIEAERRLQMPPVVLERKDINRVLSEDPALKGYNDSKHVFTDITFGVSERDRIIVVRDENGKLRDASWEERFRMNQIYFPVPGRKIRMPRSFEPENMKQLFSEEHYEFVLDRACVQFEPDDPDFIRVTTAAYDHIDNANKYELLRSTRHFGPLAFYLAWNKRIDNLLLDVIHYERIDDAVSLVKLYHHLHPDAKSAKTSCADEAEFVTSFIRLDSAKKDKLELAIESYIEMLKRRQEEGSQRAHSQ